MARRLNPVPTYRLHSPSGQAVITLRTAEGKRHDMYLGAYDSPESRAEYARIVQELATRAVPSVATADAPAHVLTVAELLLAFLPHAERHYRHPDGTLTSEIPSLRAAIRATRQLYGHTPVTEFGPLALKAIRKRMIDSGLSRPVVNSRVGRIRLMFRWGVSEELVPETVYRALTTVAGL